MATAFILLSCLYTVYILPEVLQRLGGFLLFLLSILGFLLKGVLLAVGLCWFVWFLFLRE